MRVFLCSYNGFSLAIPAKNVLSIFLYNEEANPDPLVNSGAAHETGNKSVCLPFLFDEPEAKIHHGVIVKKECSPDRKRANVLLTTEIYSESVIPQEKIYPLPETLNLFRISNFLSGIYFNCAAQNKNKQELVLFLDIQKLLNVIGKEALS
jgi:hypothetical protein